MTTALSHRGLALVTGASSGLGRAFARRLARDGYDLILVARRQARLERLAVELNESHNVSAETLPADLSDPTAVRRLARRVDEETRLELLVNNAGFGEMAPFVDGDADRLEALIALQVTALTRLTRAALPGMISRRSGSIINVSSRLAMSEAIPSPPMPPRAVYAATKAYVNTFTRLLRAEIEATGVRVQALCPGLTRTEFFERMGRDPASLPEAEVMDPADVVTASLASLDLGETICIPALDHPALLDAVDDARRDVFQHSNSSTLAGRYTS